jgi:glycosyltransferase involved in cell wall biosynthesis
VDNQFNNYHVVYILTKLELGGAQKVCLALMQGMANHNVPATLISGHEGELVEEAKKLDSVNLITCLRREIVFTSFITEVRALVTITRLLRNLKKQHGNIIVHTHSTKAGVIGRWAAFFAGISTRVHTIHGYGFHEHQNRVVWFLIYLCELFTSFITTHFVCVSEHDQKIGIRCFPLFARKSSIIRAAIEQSKFLPLAKNVRHVSAQRQKFIIGTISCFKPQKNLFDLLKAFEKMYHTHTSTSQRLLELQIIGDGILRPEIESWILTHGLSKTVLLLGWQQDVVPYLQSWDVFALSSFWEGLPCAVIEARLCKLPVIAYNVGGISEIITHGNNGFLISPGNWQELAHHFGLVLKNQILYEQLKHHHEALDDFNVPSMVKHHLNLYARLLPELY